MHRADLPWPGDALGLYDRVRTQPMSLLLDSQGAGRYDLILSQPVASSRQWRDADGQIRWRHDGWQPALADGADAFAVLQALQDWGSACFDLPLPVADLPFVSGCAGYLAYAAPAEAGLPAVRHDDWPLATLAYYRQGVVLDHDTERCTAWCLGSGTDWQHWLRQLQQPATAVPARFRLQGSMQAQTSRERYAADIARIHDYIRAGDCYQVNYTQCWQGRYHGDPWTVYPALRALSKAPYGAFWQLPWGELLCLSPEQFLTIDQGRVVTRPIKGTQPRRASAAADRETARTLQRSPKDQAENVMITDLLRNDIGKHARVGSVKVPALCRLESFGQVHHLVSTIEAELRPGVDVPTLVRDAFPGGSITGAPKKRVMEIIDELEVSPRGVYCGSLFLWDRRGRFDSNITIRTLVASDGVIRAWAGGGITLDSNWRDEHAECDNKIGRLLQALAAS